MHSHLPVPARSAHYMADARRLNHEADLLSFEARQDLLTDHQGQHLRRAAAVARRRARARMTSGEARRHG